MHNCMVKASNNAEANYGLTGLIYARTNAVYRFYGYDLVIDDALASDPFHDLNFGVNFRCKFSV